MIGARKATLQSQLRFLKEVTTKKIYFTAFCRNEGEKISENCRRKIVFTFKSTIKKLNNKSRCICTHAKQYNADSQRFAIVGRQLTGGATH